VARVLDDELIGNWTLVGDELEQLSGRRGATKLGFALLLRFYAVHGRFPAGRSEIPDQVVAHVARLVNVPPDELGFYEWDGRTIKAHRADVRRYFGLPECSVGDADKAAEWLAANVCEKERQVDQVREELLAHLKGEQIEPPARDRVRRIIGTALRQAEQALTARIASRIPAEAAARMRGVGIASGRVQYPFYLGFGVVADGDGGFLRIVVLVVDEEGDRVDIGGVGGGGSRRAPRGRCARGGHRGARAGLL
jgi:hypothetical protein